MNTRIARSNAPRGKDSVLNCSPPGSATTIRSLHHHAQRNHADSTEELTVVSPLACHHTHHNNDYAKNDTDNDNTDWGKVLSGFSS
ncbi:hypothetical protein [Bifidobacterium sp.]|jgi:hypothetical protein|uniref:hypothetical protein n=1 Tax=Bifidobacterium sp. TaxID=41200 RepID=UPI0025C07655|nr:hypothetical protein [Bifidobacterium sp.]MCI1635230.1 hypothetical protein [Bifidobacterium sp.]